VRHEGVEVPKTADHVIDRFRRLQRDLNWITADTWIVLGDQLPALLREAVTLTRSLLWEETAPVDLLSPAEKRQARRWTTIIEERLLLLEAGAVK
jgi:hypothetical protein